MIKGLFCVIILALWNFSGVNAQGTGKETLSLIPYPVNLTEGEGSFVFTEKTVLSVEDKSLKPIVEDFLTLFKDATGFSPKLKLDSKKGDVCLRTDATLPEEGYAL